MYEQAGFIVVLKLLIFRGAVYEAQGLLKHHRCPDPMCDTHLWKVRHELDMAKLRIRQLEKSMDSHGIKPPHLRYATIRWAFQF